MAAPDARCLVLGTVPGAISIERGEYYANPRNAFWRIAHEILAVDSSAQYVERTRQLREAGVALWDVLKSAERVGSLDSKIIRGTEVPNDIAGFISSHQHVRRVVLNGKAAGRMFRRFIRPTLEAAGIRVEVVELPSTSPANTRYSMEQKVAAWSALAVENGI